jgi:hypothetical protein
VLFVFLGSCLFFFLFCWLGKAFLESKTAEEVPARVPSLRDVTDWMARPDTGWYLTIIENGYENRAFSLDRQANWAFFPGYPLLVKLFADAASMDYRGAGALLSLLFYLLALFTLWRLLALDFDQATILRTLVLIAFYPFSFSLAGFGPDSLALFTSCAAFYCARKERWVLAGLLGGVTSGVRAQGILLLLPLLYLYLSSRSFDWKRIDRRCLGLFLVPTGLVAFMIHLYARTGNAFAFSDIQYTWVNSAAAPFAAIAGALETPRIIGHYGWNPEMLSIAFTLSIIPVVVWAQASRRIPLEYTLFAAVQLLVLVSRQSTLGNLRYLLGIFPYFLVLAVWGTSTKVFLFMLAIFTGALGLFLALFASGYHSVSF